MRLTPNHVSLSGRDWLLYHLAALVPLGVAAFFAVRAAYDGTLYFPAPLVLLTFVPVGLGLLFVLRRGLRFEEFTTTSEPGKNFERVTEAAERLGWHISRAVPGELIVADVPPADEVLSGFGSRPYQGERVTVRFYRGSVYVNSIFQPGEKPFLNALSRHKRNRLLVGHAVGAV